MAGSDNFTGQKIQDTYQRVLQISSSGELADGTGSLVPLLEVTASHAVSASVEITHELSSSHAQTADTGSYILASNIDQPFTNITASGDISARRIIVTGSNGVAGIISASLPASHLGITQASRFGHIYFNGKNKDRITLEDGTGNIHDGAKLMGAGVLGSIYDIISPGTNHFLIGSDAAGISTHISGSNINMLAGGNISLYPKGGEIRLYDDQTYVFSIKTEERALSAEDNDRFELQANLTASGDISSSGTITAAAAVFTTADINGGTVDGITSLTAGGNLDIGSHDFRAQDIQADGGDLIIGDGGDESILLKNNVQTSLIIAQGDDSSTPYLTVGAGLVQLPSDSHLDITSTAPATNATGDTGALRVEGGASIAKNISTGEITASGNITALSYMSASSFITNGHVTASGEISASTVITTDLKGTGDTTGLEVGGYISASGATSVISGMTLSASGDLHIGDDADIKGDLTVVGIVSASSTATSSFAHVKVNNNLDVAGDTNITGETFLQDDMTVANGWNLRDNNGNSILYLSGNSGLYILGRTIRTNDTNGIKFGADSDYRIMHANTPERLLFQYGASTKLTMSASIFGFSTDSKVGIGTTTAGTELEVVGDVSASGTIVGSNLSGTNTGDQNLSNLAVTGSDVTFANVTASGNISSSGDIIAKAGTGSFGYIEVYGSISASGTTFAANSVLADEIQVTDDLRVDGGNIYMGGGGTISATTAGSSFTNRGNITLSNSTSTNSQAQINAGGKPAAGGDSSANMFYGNNIANGFADDVTLNFMANMTASGEFSASGHISTGQTIYGNNLEIATTASLNYVTASIVDVDGDTIRMGGETFNKTLLLNVKDGFSSETRAQRPGANFRSGIRTEGSISASGDVSASGNVYSTRLYLGDELIRTDGNFIDIPSSGLIVGEGIQAESHITASGDVSSSSNIIGTNIGDISSDFIPVTPADFTFSDDNSRAHSGFTPPMGSTGAGGGALTVPNTANNFAIKIVPTGMIAHAGKMNGDNSSNVVSYHQSNINTPNTGSLGTSTMNATHDFNPLVPGDGISYVIVKWHGDARTDLIYGGQIFIRPA